MYDIFVVCGNLYRSKSQESSSASDIALYPFSHASRLLAPKPRIACKKTKKK
jgi:hypothetical protein